jgi:hypothetical protein
MIGSLMVTARLKGAIALPRGPLALDSLLAAAAAKRDQIPPALTPADVVPIEIPVKREPNGRFHLASFSISQTECYERRWINRRYPVPEAQAMGDAKLKRIDIKAGPCKSYRLPLETQHLVDDALYWWCIGDRREIIKLLHLITHLGKKRAAGLGQVKQWLVESFESWGDGFPVMREGKPLRTLPHDWSGLIDPPLAHRVLTYPYWIHTREELCAVPL